MDDAPVGLREGAHDGVNYTKVSTGEIASLASTNPPMCEHKISE